MVSQWYEFLCKNLDFSSKTIFEKIQNTIRLTIIWPNLLNNLTFYLTETMLKPTETSKNSVFLRKNCKNFMYLKKIAKISCIWKKLQKISCIWKKLQKFQVFGKNCRNLIILANLLLLLI